MFEIHAIALMKRIRAFDLLAKCLVSRDEGAGQQKLTNKITKDTQP